MSAFLFISAPAGAKLSRRVDLSNFPSLFAEVEELAAPRDPGVLLTRLLALLLILVFAVGDTLLVTRPDTLTRSLPLWGSAAPTRTVTSL